MPPRKVRRDSTKNLEKRFKNTTGCDVDKEIVVVANYSVDADQIKTIEYKQTYQGALSAAKDCIKFGSELVILESTANYHLLFFDVLKENGLNVQVINPLTVKALLKVEGKNDKADAITLARLAASFSLRTSNMPDGPQRHIRLFLRTLDKVKRSRTQLLNRTQSTLAAYGITVFNVTRLNSVSGLGIVAGICNNLSVEKTLEQYWKGNDKSLPKLKENFGRVELVPQYARLILNEILDEIHVKNDEVKAKELQSEMLVHELGLSEIVSLMMTAPAMTALLALRILGEMGIDFTERYSSNEKFVKAIGVCPDNKVSGGKVLKKQSSHGNKHCKSHLLNSVKSYCVTTRKDHELKAFFDAYKKRSTFKKAVSATARKLMVSIYAMVKTNQPYRYERQIVEEAIDSV